MSSTLTTQLELRPGTQIFEFDSSTQEKTYRVELSDGRHFQVNETLYHLLDSLRIPMSLSGLAAQFQLRTGQLVSTEHLETLREQLEETGVVIPAGSSITDAAPASQADSLMSMHYRRDLVPPRFLAPVARLLQIFFNRPTAIILGLLVLGVHILFVRQAGFPPQVNVDALSPTLLVGIMLLSVLVHELGHLAACARWNCPHGPLGIGLYFITLVFYVDVTAAWRLTRQQRAIVDMGGIYLQMLCVPIVWLLFVMTETQPI